MREPKDERFRRVAEARVNKIIKMVRLLGNCAGAAYVHTPEQVAQIFNVLQYELNQAKARYAMPEGKKQRFSLSDTTEKNKIADRPTIELPLSDGTCLKAVAYSDEIFPAINVYWDSGTGQLEKPVCFVKYNPQLNCGPEVYVGAYQSHQDDTMYYQPYIAAERKKDE